MGPHEYFYSLAQMDFYMVAMAVQCSFDLLEAHFLCCRLQIPFDRQKAIKLSGMSEKAYTRSLNAMQNALGVR